MKNYFKRIQWPLSLFALSVVIILYTITFGPAPLSLSLQSHSEAQKIKIGNVSPGNYHFYTKWEYQGDTVGSLPADIEISNDKGEMIATRLESDTSTLSSEFTLKEEQNLHAVVRILDAESISGSVAKMVIDTKKTWGGFTPVMFSFLGILVAVAWMLKIFVFTVLRK